MRDISQLAAAAENLVKDALVAVYEDDLVAEEMTRLTHDHAVQVVADRLN
jgi:hypothetical protein